MLPNQNRGIANPIDPKSSLAFSGAPKKRIRPDGIARSSNTGPSRPKAESPASRATATIATGSIGALPFLASVPALRGVGPA
jgi:hypothetical protein